MPDGIYLYESFTPPPYIQLAASRLEKNSIQKLILGSTGHCFLNTRGARQLWRPFAANTSLASLVLYLRHTTTPAVRLLLRAAARCRSLTSLTVVGGLTFSEARAVAAALGAFCRAPTSPHYAAAAARRAPRPSMRTPPAAPSARVGRSGGLDNAARRGSPCPSSSVALLQGGGGHDGKSCAPCTPRHSVRLTLVPHDLDAAVVDLLVEGLRRSGRITSIALRVLQGGGWSSQTQKDLLRYAASLEAAVVSNREYMRYLESQTRVGTSRPSSPHASLCSAPLQPSRFAAGDSKKRRLRQAGLNLVSNAGKEEGTLRPLDVSLRVRTHMNMLGANERRQCRAPEKLALPDVSRARPSRGSQTTGAEQKACIVPHKPEKPLNYCQPPPTSYFPRSSGRYHRVRSRCLSRIVTSSPSDASGIANGYFADKSRLYSYGQGAIPTPPSRRYSPAQLIPQPPQRPSGRTALSTHPNNKDPCNTTENVGIKPHRCLNANNHKLSASPYQCSVSSSHISSRISHWRGTLSSASSSVISSPPPRPPARLHGKTTEIYEDEKSSLTAHLQHPPGLEPPPSPDTFPKMTTFDVPPPPQPTLFGPCLLRARQQRTQTSPTVSATQCAATNTLVREGASPGSPARDACTGFASAHRCFVCNLLGAGGCSPERGPTIPRSESRVEKKNRSGPHASCESSSRTTALLQGKEKVEVKGDDAQTPISLSSSLRQTCGATLRPHEEGMGDAFAVTSKSSAEIPTFLSETLKPCHACNKSVPLTSGRNSFTMKEIHDSVKTTARQLDRRARFHRFRATNSGDALCTSHEHRVENQQSPQTGHISPLRGEVVNVQRPVLPSFPPLSPRSRRKPHNADAWVAKATNSVDEYIKGVEEGDSEEVTPLKEYPSLETTPRLDSAGALKTISPTPQTSVSYHGKCFEISGRKSAVVNLPLFLTSSSPHESHPTHMGRRYPDNNVAGGLKNPHSLQKRCLEQLQECVQDIQEKLENYCAQVKEETSQVVRHVDQLSGVMVHEVSARLSDVLVVFKDIENNQISS